VSETERPAGLVAVRSGGGPQESGIDWWRGTKGADGPPVVSRSPAGEADKELAIAPSSSEPEEAARPQPKLRNREPLALEFVVDALSDRSVRCGKSSTCASWAGKAA
jgi:hypothetical protein